MALLCFSQQKIQVLSLYDIHVQNRRAQYLNDSQAQMAIRANVKVCILFCLWKHCAVSVIQKEEHREKGYWGESLGTRRQQWREKKGGSGSENAAVSSLCSVFAPPCLLCCFLPALSAAGVCDTHTETERQCTVMQKFSSLCFSYVYLKRDSFDPQLRPMRRTLHDISCWDKNVFCSEENVDLCPSVHFLQSASFCLTSLSQKLSTCLFTNVKKNQLFLKKNIYFFLLVELCDPHPTFWNMQSTSQQLRHREG